MSVPRRFAVLQPGARMHYAVPALLASAGMLDALYTDIHAGCWPARVLDAVWPRFGRPRALRRLLGRRLPPELPPGSVRTVPLASALRTFLGRDAGPGVTRRLLAENFGAANALYTFAHGDIAVLRAARDRGMFTVFEQVIGPNLNRYLREERAHFPGLEPQESAAHCAAYIDAHRAVWDCADLVLAPSDFVAEGIAELGGAPEKVRFVPYGIPESLLDAEPAPQPGRVLFVGQVGLRKGSHYLAAAARILKQRHVPCEIRVVGSVPPALAASRLFDGPVYAGQVPRSEIDREFLAADVFVLPSLAEGSATAHLEALAYGLPVIATPNAGTVVRNETEGLIVPIRDANALADAIERVVTGRSLRDRLSQAARARAASFTWPRYRERLLGALTGEAAAPLCPAPAAAPAAILWHHLGPYHLARAQAVRGLCDLTVMELAASERGCGWNGHRPETPVRTLTLSPADLREEAPINTARRVWSALDRAAPRTVFIAGYGNVPFLAAALWCRLHRRRAVLFSETTPQDRPRHLLSEALKGPLVRALFDRAIVGGRRQAAYLESLGFGAHPIDRPYNVVDNAYFRFVAAELRRSATPAEFALPATPYFLYAGRLAPEKNLPFLLDAYAAYARDGGPWDLVVTGDGPLAAGLRAAAGPRVHFTGARTGRELAACYAFASCFVLASLREPWGLVLNEAMAAGLPLLVSDRCGSSADLVEAGRNAYSFDPTDERGLALCLARISDLPPGALATMGAASSAIVDRYSLEAWAAAFARALEP
jgi:glycosyltransferase involved in cell wall biosynthesis